MLPKHYLNRDGDGGLAFPRVIWPHLGDCIWQFGCQLTLKQGEHGRQHVYLSSENQFVREGPNTNQSQKERATTMTAVVRIIPYPFYGGEPFERDFWLNTRATRLLASEDLAELFGMVDDTNPSLLVAAANGQVIRCTRMVTLTIEFEGNSTVVSAWVSPSIQGEVLLGYQTLIDLGLIQASTAATKFFPEPKPDPKENNDPGKLPGDGANDEIPYKFSHHFIMARNEKSFSGRSVQADNTIPISIL